MPPFAGCGAYELRNDDLPVRAAQVILTLAAGLQRPLEDWQIAQLRRRAGRRQRHVKFLALAVGMHLKTFKRLAPAQQHQVWRAVCALTSPRNI